MQKRTGGLILGFLLVLTSLSFVSAIANFTVTGILQSFNPQDFSLLLIFGVSFVLMNFAFGRFFKGQKAVGGILAGLLALGITYFANFTNLSYTISNLIFSFGLSEEIFYPIILIGTVVLFFLIAGKGGTHLAFLGIGILLIFLSTYVYEAEILILFGGLMVILGIIFSWVKFKHTRYYGRA